MEIGFESITIMYNNSYSKQFLFSRSSAGEEYDAQSKMNKKEFLGTHHEESNTSTASSFSHGSPLSPPQPSTSTDVS